MNEVELQCLRELEYTTSGGEYAVHFKCMEYKTGFSRETVREILRRFADQGYAQYMRGLMNEEGQVAGAGYTITETGRKALALLTGGKEGAGT